MRLTARAEVLTEWLKPVSAIVDECRLRFSASQATVSAVDPANVAMVKTDVDAAAFESYETDGGQTIGVRLPKLFDVLSLTDGETPVHIALDESGGRATVTAAGLEYSFGTLDPDSIRREPDIPDMDWPVELVLEHAELADAITAADFCAEHLRIRGDADLGYQAAASGDVDELTYSLNPASVARGGTADSLFSLDYLHDIIGPLPEEVRVQLGEEVPLDLRYSLLDGDCDVRALLAPRIDS